MGWIVVQPGTGSNKGLVLDQMDLGSTRQIGFNHQTDRGHHQDLGFNQGLAGGDEVICTRHHRCRSWVSYLCKLAFIMSSKRPGFIHHPGNMPTMGTSPFRMKTLVAHCPHQFVGCYVLVSDCLRVKLDVIKKHTTAGHVVNQVKNFLGVFTDLAHLCRIDNSKLIPKNSYVFNEDSDVIDNTITLELVMMKVDQEALSRHLWYWSEEDEESFESSFGEMDESEIRDTSNEETGNKNDNQKEVEDSAVDGNKED